MYFIFSRFIIYHHLKKASNMFSCVGIFQQLYTSHSFSLLNKQGSCCSPEKQCQSINTFGQSFNYTITLIKREKKSLSPFWELNCPLCEISMYFRYFVNSISPLGKGRGPSFEKSWIHALNPRMIFAKFGWNWVSGYGLEDF